MRNLILILMGAILFSGCATNAIKIDKQDELVVKNDLDELILSSKLTNSKILNFKNISITQNRVEDEYKRVLFYEDVSTKSYKDFHLDKLNTLVYIFGATQEYEYVYSKNDLSFYQLVLKNGERINVLVQTISSQRISFVYGFSNYEFIKLAKKIKNDSKGELKRLRYQGTTLVEKQKPLTQWSKELVSGLGKIY